MNNTFCMPEFATNGAGQGFWRQCAMAKPESKLSDRISQMDANAKMPDDIRVWIDMQPVGKEIS